jgi:hypothetical protein
MQPSDARPYEQNVEQQLKGLAVMRRLGIR